MTTSEDRDIWLKYIRSLVEELRMYEKKAMEFVTFIQRIRIILETFVETGALTRLENDSRDSGPH